MRNVREKVFSQLPPPEVYATPHTEGCTYTKGTTRIAQAWGRYVRPRERMPPARAADNRPSHRHARIPSCRRQPPWRACCSPCLAVTDLNGIGYAQSIKVVVRCQGVRGVMQSCSHERETSKVWCCRAQKRVMAMPAGGAPASVGSFLPPRHSPCLPVLPENARGEHIRHTHAVACMFYVVGFC